ncbi:flagellar hook-length control protein FliK [Shewanella morhuae]|uniref:Flagellar hook-length control protein n=1 Tax=Shewanella morhuae TaxID=365591 RepID=A0A380A976_9GAMM|nr:flagellar hook-length control protein FliK [Shewanella morhuae]SUI75663.1 Flagellar hook-length control protein [Shewanella morhuae]
MQQMTNALLSNTGNTAANSAKISSQTSNNDDFSSTLSSVSASSHSVLSAKKTPVNLDESSQVTSKDKSVDEDKLTDSDDVNLIFAQIDMANGMKKAASEGEILPLTFLDTEGETVITEDKDALSADPSLITPLSTNAVVDTQNISNVIDDTMTLSNQDVKNQSMATNISSAINSDEDNLINQAAIAKSMANNSAQTGLKTANITTSANTLELDTLGSPIASEVSKTETGSKSSLDADSDAAASLLLKDAKLTVAMDISRDNNLIDDDSSFSDLKPASSTHGLSLSQLNRQETVSVQLSLRQGVEQQNQMQEMIQRFSPVMRQQLITMVSQGIQHAEIRLDPPELGHMLVKIQVHGDQTQVQFHVTQSQTRDLVEQAMPRLRELLQDQGMQLADSHVSQGDQGHPRDGNFGDGDGSNHTDMDEIAAEELDLVLNQTTSINSGIDYYA